MKLKPALAFVCLGIGLAAQAQSEKEKSKTGTAPKQAYNTAIESTSHADAKHDYRVKLPQVPSPPPPVNKTEKFLPPPPPPPKMELRKPKAPPSVNEAPKPALKDAKESELPKSRKNKFAPITPETPPLDFDRG